jgi:pSer/pThr/pTyr-binding forkhead associated (FHA) protein
VARVSGTPRAEGIENPQVVAANPNMQTALVEPQAPAMHAGAHQEPPVQAAPAPAHEAAPANALVTCPQCSHVNTPANRFCAACGFNLVAARSNPPAAAGAPQVTGRQLRLTALRADGSESGSLDIPLDTKFIAGRDSGAIFAGDSYLSPRHASFTRQGNDIVVRDEGSLNGVYLKLKPQVPWALSFGDIFRIGQEIIRLESLEQVAAGPDGVERLGSPREHYVGRLALVIGRDTTGNAFPVPRGGVHCGRERGDILFSEDGYVSGLHCRIAPAEDGRMYLTDVGSSNGTFVRIGSDFRLTPGDILLMGQQLFRADIS